MKSQIIDPKTKRKGRFPSPVDWLGVLIPALLWLIATHARPAVLATRCSTFPEKCTNESVISMDRFSLGMEDPLADEYSYRTQNLAGIWAVAVPVGWYGLQLATGALTTPLALAQTSKSLLHLFQVVSWNGFFTETAHLIAQRPRPFVYSDPQVRGIDPAHYTSFYSGHTSFAAATTVATFLLLLGQGAPSLLLFLALAVSEALVLSTAYFRILAGRHFLSDVICGAIAGTLVAWFLMAKRQRSRG